MTAGLRNRVRGNSPRHLCAGAVRGVCVATAVLLTIGAAWAQDRQTAPKSKQNDPKFAATMQKIRETWVNEFNAGHPEKVAGFYSQDAVLMRWDGTVHGYDSILAEMQRSIAAGAHSYVAHSLHTERSGDMGYDTGAYNVTLRDRVIEGNYVIVVRRIKGEWKIVAHASVPNPRGAP